MMSEKRIQRRSPATQRPVSKQEWVPTEPTGLAHYFLVDLGIGIAKIKLSGPLFNGLKEN